MQTNPLDGDFAKYQVSTVKVPLWFHSLSNIHSQLARPTCHDSISCQCLYERMSSGGSFSTNVFAVLGCLIYLIDFLHLLEMGSSV